MRGATTTKFPTRSSRGTTSRPKRRDDRSHKDDAVEAEIEERITTRFLFSTIVATLGPGFQHGYNLGVTNSPQKVLIEWIEHISTSHLDHHHSNRTTTADYSQEEATFIFSIVVSIYSLGGILGGFFICFWNRKIGFRTVFLCSNAFSIVASFLMGFSKYQRSLTMLILGRFLMGMNNGFCSGAVIIYLAEISPTKIRGTMCSVYQLFLTISIMISQFVSIDIGLGTTRTWPLLFFLPTGVALIQFVLLPFCVDPPVYLYEIGKTTEAKEAVRKLYGDELDEVKFAILALKVHYQMRKGRPRFADLFLRDEYQYPLIISCVMMFAQQITGINVIIHYTNIALYMIDLGRFAEGVIMIIGIVNVCVTIVGLAAIDVVGRRKLLIFSFATMFMDMLAIFACFYLSHYHRNRYVSCMAIVFMIMYVAFFASGAGSIPWFLYTEFFLENMRPLAASVVVPINWLTHFIVGIPFLSFHKKLGPSVFFIFAAMDFFLLIYIMRIVPETKNQSVITVMKQFTPLHQSKVRDSFSDRTFRGRR